MVFRGTTGDLQVKVKGIRSKVSIKHKNNLSRFYLFDNNSFVIVLSFCRTVIVKSFRIFKMNYFLLLNYVLVLWVDFYARQ